MRELSPQAIRCMEGQQVIVHDCIYDEYDQLCVVKLTKEYIYKPNRKRNQVEERITGITLENDEFVFQYVPPFFDKCLYGKFKVYPILKEGEEDEKEEFK